MIELLPNEIVLLTKSANLVVDSAEFGLTPLPGTVLRRGMLVGGDESLGGKLILTNLRLIFEPHAVNRVQAVLVVPLELISALTNASRGISRMVRVDWSGHSRVIVVWGIPALIARITDARDRLTRQ